MKVLIVARTVMGKRRCIGGLAENRTSIRLLRSNGDHWMPDAPFEVGDVFDVTYTVSSLREAPHLEDVLVSDYEYLGREDDLYSHLLYKKGVVPWQGHVNRVFDGLVQYTSSNNGYISRRRGVPGRSTWFWIPDRPLHLRIDGKHYDYVDEFGVNRGMSYVGECEPLESIPAHALVRLSLARWWKPDDADESFEERCYLQLSGWFVSAGKLSDNPKPKRFNPNDFRL